MKNNIDTKSARLRLKIRREPYWIKFATGGHVGYRRTTTGGAWLARYRPHKGNRVYETFGELSDIDETDHFNIAMELANSWVMSMGIVSENAYTVEHTISDYIEHLKINNSDRAAYTTRLRLKYSVSVSLRDIKLSKLTLKIMTDWLNSMVSLSHDPEIIRKSKLSANRVKAMLCASLNLAYRKNIIGNNKAWRNLKSFQGVIKAREVYLTDDQINALYKNTSGNFHELIKSAMLTGARYSELTHAKVCDLDYSNYTLFLDGKTGVRFCYLSDRAIKHFKKLSTDKLPNALIHTNDSGNQWKSGDQSERMAVAVKRAKLPRATVFYTLRHTHISKALLAGVNIQVIAENCGTSIRMIEKHYGKFLKEDRRAMFNQADIG